MIPNLLSAFFPQNKRQMNAVTRSMPALAPIMDREAMIAGNPLKPVGDMATRALGGDPNAGILDAVDPTRSRSAHTAGYPMATADPDADGDGDMNPAEDKDKDLVARQIKEFGRPIDTLGGTEPVPETGGTPITDKFYPGAPRPGITEEMLRQDRERRAASRQDKVFDARTGEELSPERRAQILKDVAIKAAKTGQSGDYATDGTFLGNSSGPGGSEVDGGTDWDTWSREVDAGLRTPPFVSSPGWEAARRRQSDGTAPGQPSFYPGASPDTALEGRPDPLQDAYARRADLQKNGAKKQPKFWKRVLSGALQGIGQGMATGNIGAGIGGGIAGAALGGFFPGAERRMRTPYEVARVDQEIQGLEQQRTANQRQKASDAAIENTRFDNKIASERLGEMKADRLRKEDDRRSRERTARMTQVAGMFKSLPAYDPTDPRFTELTKALGDVELPITPKDAKKNVKLVQDQRTGQWTTILTDPMTGREEVRNVMKDGQPFSSTPTVVMQGEYGMLRQNDQQDFTARQNEIDRQFKAQMESARIQAQAGFKQMEAAEGRQKALEKERAKFVAAWQKQFGRPPSETDITNYLDAVVGQ